MTRNMFLATLLVSVSSIAVTALPAHAQQITYSYTRVFTVPPVTANTQIYTGGIAVDLNGNLFVSNYEANSVNGNVCKFSATGTLLTRFGFAEGNGSLNGITTDMDGNIFRSVFSYATATTNIFKYTNAGLLLNSASPRYTGFTSITSNSIGNVFVSHCYDSPNSPVFNTIKKFANDLTFLSQFTSGYFYLYPGNRAPAQIFGIAVDPSGNVFASTSSQSGVLKFDSAGNYVTTFAVNYTPKGIATDGNGRIYITSGNDGGKVLIMNPDGTHYAVFSVASLVPTPSQIAVSANGNKVFVTGGEAYDGSNKTAYVIEFTRNTP